MNDSPISDLEAIPILLRIKKAKPILLINWYRPPNSKCDLLDQYEQFLEFTESIDCHLIVIGDINMDIRKDVDDYVTKRYKQINSIYSLQFINSSECTRITNESASLIDHMSTNSIEMIKSHGVIHNGVSDHSMSYLIWKAHQVHSGVKYVTYRKSKGVDIDTFKADLSKQNWVEVEEENCIDESTCKFEKLLFEVVNKHMPVKTKRVRKTQSPWLNETIFKLMKERDLLKSKAIKTKNKSIWKDYRVLKNKVTSLITKSKRKYFTEQLTKDQSRNNSWKTLSSVLPKKCSSSQPPPSQCQSMANEFNHHFANVATNLISDSTETVVESGDKMSTDSATREPCVQYPLTFSTVSESEILKEIQQLKNKKSVGLDGISVKVLKMSKDVIVRPITFLINKSITQGKVPNKWKIAKIIPLHKKGDRSISNNYRPISILSCLSKILEKVIQKQLVQHLNRNNILTIEQSGFRPKHSTSTALIKVTDEWLKSLDNGLFTGAVFVDLQKAFDMVNPKCLLNKLSTIGINGPSLKWFENYLSDRRIVTPVGPLPRRG